MALSINTNIASLNAQRNLGKTQGTLNKSLQRLSSGLRINSAKDDAAGLAISNRMASQVRGLNQAVRNANDAISLSQTAEGALQESTSILQRMRELSVQSANDTNTASDRASMQAEISQLLSELDRVAETTQFNGKNLLDGSMIDATFHVGANAGANQTISFDIGSAQTEELSSVGTTISAPNGTAVSGTNVTGALLADTLTVNGNDVAAAAGTAVDIAAAINTANDTDIATAVNSQTFAFEDMTLESVVAEVGDDSGGVSGGADAVAATGTYGTMTFTADAAGAAGNYNIIFADAVQALAVGISGNDITITADFGNVPPTSLAIETALNDDVTIGALITVTGGDGTAADLTDGGTLMTGGADATAGTADITTLSDVLAATVDTVDITIEGDALTMNWDLVAGASSWDDVTTMAELETALDSQANLSASLASTTLTLTTAAGDSLAFGGSGALQGSSVTGTYTLTVDGANVSVAAGADGVVNASDVVTTVDGTAGYTASVDADNNITVANDDGTVLSMQEETTGTNVGAGFADTAASSTGVDHQGQISLDSTSDITFTGTGLTNAGLGDVGNATTTIDLVDVSTRAGATTAITSIDSALSEIDEMRGEMGAVQNRFESTISNLQNVSENISAARSRIVDADFAAETAALTKSQILQQAGIAMLAQANQLPQAVLSLLQ
jgi:flagellin